MTLLLVLNFLLLPWTSQTVLRTILDRMQDSGSSILTSLQATTCAKRPTQREAWHTAPFPPSLERLEQKWAGWDCCVGLRKKGTSGISGKKFKFLFFLLFLLPIPRIRAKRADDSHLETDVCSFTPPCPPWLRLWDPESNLTVLSPFLLPPSFAAAWVLQTPEYLPATPPPVPEPQVLVSAPQRSPGW